MAMLNNQRVNSWVNVIQLEKGTGTVLLEKLARLAPPK